jgi:hypothetical protein
MIKRGYVYHGSTEDAARLGQRLAGWFAADERAYMVVFRPDDREFTEFDLNRAQEMVAAWDEGRVFSAKREARWRKQGQGYDIWLLAEDGNLPQDLDGLRQVEAGPQGWQAVERVRQKDGVYVQGVYLWGQYQHQQQAWVEVRLPRKIKYPVKPPSKDETDTAKLFARIGHIDYRASNGAVQFVRLTEVR